MTEQTISRSSAGITLSREAIEKDQPGFIQTSQTRESGIFAKTIASAYIKFTAQGQALTEDDSVQGFVTLAQLHQELTDEISQFLQSDVTFTYDDQQIQPFLLEFATYRLKTLEKQLKLAAIQDPKSDETISLKDRFKQAQAEYDNVLQAG